MYYILYKWIGWAKLSETCKVKAAWGGKQMQNYMYWNETVV